MGEILIVSKWVYDFFQIFMHEAIFCIDSYRKDWTLNHYFVSYILRSFIIELDLSRFYNIIYEYRHASWFFTIFRTFSIHFDYFTYLPFESYFVLYNYLFTQASKPKISRRGEVNFFQIMSACFFIWQLILLKIFFAA